MMFLKSILLLHKMRCRPCFSNYTVLLVLNQLRAMQVRIYTNDFLLQMYFICFLKHCPPCISSWLIYNILCKVCSEMPIWRIRSSVAPYPFHPHSQSHLRYTSVLTAVHRHSEPEPNVQRSLTLCQHPVVRGSYLEQQSRKSPRPKKLTIHGHSFPFNFFINRLWLNIWMTFLHKNI